MAGWAEFIAAVAAFFATHAFPVRPPLRPWLVARLGARGFTLAYSVLSLAVLVWVVGAAGRAPFVPLWYWAPWQNLVTLALMLPVCVIPALALGVPNPFSFLGGRDADFDPDRPGIVGWMRHPLLVALALWAGAHLVPNGDLAHVLVFGPFTAFAVFGGRLVDRRKRRMMGPTVWADLDRRRRAARRAPGPQTWLRLMIGVGTWLALIALHPLLFGVSPLT